MNVAYAMAVVEAYVHHRTGNIISIDIGCLSHPEQYSKLALAYQIAQQWFLQNNGTITLKQTNEKHTDN